MTAKDRDPEGLTNHRAVTHIRLTEETVGWWGESVLNEPKEGLTTPRKSLTQTLLAQELFISQEHVCLVSLPCSLPGKEQCVGAVDSV